MAAAVDAPGDERGPVRNADAEGAHQGRGDEREEQDHAGAQLHGDGPHVLVVLEVAAEEVIAEGVVREVAELEVPVVELSGGVGFAVDVDFLGRDGEDGGVCGGGAGELVDAEADEEEDEGAGEDYGEEETDGPSDDGAGYVREEGDSGGCGGGVAGRWGIGCSAHELDRAVAERVAADQEEQCDHCAAA